MHEISLIKNMVAILDKEVVSPGVGEVKTVHLEVGQLRYVVPEIMVSCFEEMPRHDKLRDAKLNIETLPIKVSCSDCGSVSEIKEGEYLCSNCRSDNVEFVSGDEFRIKGIEW